MRGGRKSYQKVVLKGLIFIALLSVFAVIILFGCSPAHKMSRLVGRDAKLRAKMDSLEKHYPELASKRTDKLTIIIPEKHIEAETDLKEDSNYLNSLQEERVAKNASLYLEEFPVAATSSVFLTTFTTEAYA